jgi:hypothetical protein
MDRRQFLKASAALGAGIALPSVAPGWLPDALAHHRRKMFWGAAVQRRDGEDPRHAVRRVERMVGRRFGTVHSRFSWEVSPVNRLSEWAAEHGRVPILSWFTRSQRGGMISWQSIADGEHDARIRTEARRLRSAGWFAYFCFHKEPENEGRAEDYRAAYRRVREIFGDVGVPNIKWVVALMAATYNGHNGGADAWLPANYDILGVDGYNRYTCNSTNGWRSFRRIFEPARTIARRKGKKLYIVEFGCVEGERGRKAKWFDAARARMKDWPEVVGASYNHERGSRDGAAGCTFYIDTSRSALRRFSAMGADPHFRR